MRAGLAIDTKTMNTIGAVYHGGFGLGLYADPNAFADSGPSPLKYTADAEGPVGEFLGRAFGGMMLAMMATADARVARTMFLSTRRFPSCETIWPRLICMKKINGKG